MKVKQIEVITYEDEMIPEVKDVLDFLEGLKDNVAARAFIKNLEILQKVTLERYLEEVEEENIGGMYTISSAFEWRKTSEGIEYWNLVNQLWRKHWEEVTGQGE